MSSMDAKAVARGFVEFQRPSFIIGEVLLEFLDTSLDIRYKRVPKRASLLFDNVVLVDSNLFLFGQLFVMPLGFVRQLVNPLITAHAATFDALVMRGAHFLWGAGE